MDPITFGPHRPRPEATSTDKARKEQLWSYHARYESRVDARTCQLRHGQTPAYVDAQSVNVLDDGKAGLCQNYRDLLMRTHPSLTNLPLYPTPPTSQQGQPTIIPRN